MADAEPQIRKRKGQAPPLDEIRPYLCNNEVGPESYTGEAEKYQPAVLEQYKVYVEMGRPNQ